jgi:hypothetical protein
VKLFICAALEPVRPEGNPTCISQQHASLLDAALSGLLTKQSAETPHWLQYVIRKLESAACKASNACSCMVFLNSKTAQMFASHPCVSCPEHLQPVMTHGPLVMTRTATGMIQQSIHVRHPMTTVSVSCSACLDCCAALQRSSIAQTATVKLAALLCSCNQTTASLN